MISLIVKGFTGYENSCEVVYYDGKGDYLKSRLLENLDYELKVNAHGNHAVGIISYTCITYDDQFISGKPEELQKHEVYQIERALTEEVDWLSWDLSQEFDANDFMSND
jgi:hypothetical protein